MQLSEFHECVRLAARREPWNHHVDCVLSYCRNGLPQAVCRPLEFEEVKEGACVTPTFRLYEKQAQDLMDMLWDAGLRPSQTESTAGHLQAVEHHLADMRAIAFQATGIDAPKS